MKLPSPAEYRKGLVILGAVLVNILSLGLPLPDDVQRWLVLAVNLLAAVGVITVPNRRPESTP